MYDLLRHRPQAFLAASLKSDSELWAWFRERLIWDDPKVVQDLLRNGLFYRIYTPQVGGRRTTRQAAEGPNPEAINPKLRCSVYLNRRL